MPKRRTRISDFALSASDDDFGFKEPPASRRKTIRSSRPRQSKARSSINAKVDSGESSSDGDIEGGTNVMDFNSRDLDIGKEAAEDSSEIEALQPSSGSRLNRLRKEKRIASKASPISSSKRKASSPILSSASSDDDVVPLKARGKLWSKDVKCQPRSMSSSKGRDTGTLLSSSSSDDDVVPGKPKGRLWLKEVRIPFNPLLAQSSFKSITALHSQKYISNANLLQTTSQKRGSTRSSPIAHPKVSNMAGPRKKVKLSHGSDNNSTNTVVRTTSSRIAHARNVSTQQNKSDTKNSQADRKSMITATSDTEMSADNSGEAESTDPSRSTGLTSTFATPEPSNNTLGRARRAAAARAGALFKAFSYQESNDGSEESDVYRDSGLESESTAATAIDSSGNSDVSEEESDEEEVITTKVARKNSGKAAKKSGGNFNATSAAKGKDINNEDVEIDWESISPRLYECDYLCGIDQKLPPISKINDIFLDITEKALKVKGRNLQTKASKKNGPTTTIHVRQDLKTVLDQLNGRKLRVATMCSGTESPLLALELISDALKIHGRKFEITHLFSAEIVPFKQAYIERNFAPPIIFRDITEMTDPKATTATTAYGAKIDIPGDVDLLVTGFSCVDHSNLNNNKAGLSKNDTADTKEKAQAKKPSESGDTMNAMLAYIAKFRPRIAIIENVYGAPWDKLEKLLSDRDYESSHLKLDTKDFYIPQTRQRGYMFCVDRRLYTRPKEPPIATKTWQALMEGAFKRPASTAVEDFLLNESDPRLTQGRRELSSGRGEKATGRAVDWVRCQARHEVTRHEDGLGNKHPLTKWQQGGYCKPLDFFWSDWTHGQVERVWDCIDMNFLRKVTQGYDNQYKARVIDLSQNVDRVTDSTKAGVTPCLTPSGIPFSTMRGGPIIGLESLALQGLPIDKLQLTQESQSDLQDLAGNAMTATVAGAALLGGLISACQVLPRGDDNDTDTSSEPLQAIQDCLEHHLERVKISLGNYTPLTVKDAQDAASRSIRLCTCENTSGVARGIINRCFLCQHTTCTSCGGNPRHEYVPYPSIERITPVKFESMITASLPMKMTLSGVATADLENLRALIVKTSFFTKKQAALASAAVSKAFRSELSFCSQPERAEAWTFSFDSQNASMKLILSATVVEWRFFAKVPSEEAVDSPVRKLLSKPIARMIPTGLDLTKGDWQLRLPVAYEFKAAIRGDNLTRSFENRLGLEHYKDTKVHGSYGIETIPSVKGRLGIDINGTYKLLPNCGTASGALHVQTNPVDPARPVFLFLDPDRLGKPKDDCFVFATDKTRIVKGERSVIARVDKTWRPARMKEVENPDGSGILQKHDVWIKEFTDEKKKRHKKFGEWYSDLKLPKEITCYVDCTWLDLPTVSLQPKHMIGSFQRAQSSFRLTPGPRSCQTAHLVLKCEAQVSEGDLKAWRKPDWVQIDKVNEIPFFTTFAWLTEKARSSSELAKWHVEQGGISRHCKECSPTPPRIMWKFAKDGKILPFEHHGDAAKFEKSLKSRPSPLVAQIYVSSIGLVSLKLSINPETLMHRAATTLCPSNSDDIEMSWRLVTNHNPSAIPNFPKLTLKNNEFNATAQQPPSFGKRKLREDQLRSLNWMIGQERNPKLFCEEEVEESVQNQLGWRLEGRAYKNVLIRGGVLADQVGFGKTATTLALIDTQRSMDLESSKISVQGRISVKATLILVPSHLPDQWKREVDKFMLEGQLYKVIVIKTITDLRKYTIADFESADIIIVSWKFCENEAYLFKVAQLAGRNELPSNCSSRTTSAWYKEALADIAPHVDELKRGGKGLYSMIEKKIKQDQENATKVETFTPSKRLRGQKYRDAKQAATIGSKRKRTVDDVDESVGSSDDKSTAPLKFEEKKARGDDFRLKDIAKNLNWKHMPYPLLELFEFSRVVVDEYTYATGNEGLVVANLRARSRWLLSGTPPLADFADVKSISKFLGINLGIDDVTAAVKKRSMKNLTSFELFQSCQVTHSAYWVENRHRVAQGFLDHFVRQNFVDLEKFPSSRHPKLVVLPAAERAVYLELQSVLAASNGLMVTSKLNPENDRESRIQQCFAESNSGEEALIKCASHFALNPDPITDTGESEEEPEESFEVLEMDSPGRFGNSDYVEADGDLELDDLEQNDSDAIVHTRLSQCRAIYKKFLLYVIKSEKLYASIKTPAAQYRKWKSKVWSSRYGDAPACVKMQELTARAVSQCQAVQVQYFEQHEMASQNRILRDLTNKLDQLSTEFVSRFRSLRYMKSIASLRNTTTISCDACFKKSTHHTSSSILVECGHIVCDGCLSSRLDASHDDFDENEYDMCVVAGCQAINKPNQVVPTDKFKHESTVDVSIPNHGRKIKDIIKLLLRIPNNEQVLLFVQYPELIRKVEVAFKENKISYASPDNAADPSEVIQSFQMDTTHKKKKVLILNIGDESAAGSNLTNATHVVFFAPYSSTTEQLYKQAMVQAEARARREGQTQHVHIYHFAAQDTVEVEILQLRKE